MHFLECDCVCVLYLDLERGPCFCFGVAEHPRKQQAVAFCKISNLKATVDPVAQP
jgi:hypothetical protein